MAVDAAPFAHPPYELAADLVLDTMTPGEAVAAGTLCASIDPWASYPMSRDHLVAFFSRLDPNGPRFALNNGGSLAGSIAIRIDWLLGPYIQMLMVAPAFQGHGFGTAMLTWAEREARSNANRNLWIAASSTNAAALALYTRHGFAPVARLDALIRDGRDEILMRKKLF